MRCTLRTTRSVIGASRSTQDWYQSSTSTVNAFRRRASSSWSSGSGRKGRTSAADLAGGALRSASAASGNVGLWKARPTLFQQPGQPIPEARNDTLLIELRQVRIER